MTDLDKCVQCGLCLTACPTFRLSGMEGYSPRGRIASVRAAQAGAPALLDEYLSTCLGCRACEAVCPSGVPYGHIPEEARAMRGASRVERFVLWFVGRRGWLSVVSLVPYVLQKLGLLRLMAAVPRLRAARGLPSLKLRTLLVRMGTNYSPAPGARERGSVVLFTGCVQDAWSREVHWATISVLTRAGYRVRVPHGQRCCGALHAHAGDLDGARKLALANLEPLEQFEGTIVVNSAGCGAKLKEYASLLPDEPRAAAIASRVRDVSEVITPADVRAARPIAPLARVGVHDPCHLNFVQKIREQPRALLRAAGYEVVDLPDEGRCCGAAGSYSLHHPDWASALLDDKLDACNAVQADAIAVANPGCLFWMRSGDAAPPMYHPIELVAMALVSGSSASPSA